MPRQRALDERQEGRHDDFTAAELAYLLGERRLSRVATVGKDDTAPVAPVRWCYNDQHTTIDVGGRQFAQMKKYRGSPVRSRGEATDKREVGVERRVILAD